MKQLIESFSNHLRESIEIGKSLHWNPTFTPKNIVITGLGGSGIGGTIISNLAMKESTIPIIVNKGYFLPHFVNEDTLVITSSYSGNTEETIQAFQEAVSKKAHICSVTSGGELLKLSQEHKLNYAQIPGGFPPRSAFGYSAVQLLFVLLKYKVISDQFIKELENTIQLLDREESEIVKTASNIASQIAEKIAVIYSEDTYEGVAVRFRQQINENGKNLCWHHAIPEMNHNELVGWTKANDQLAVLFLRTEDEYFRNSARIRINKEVISKCTNTLIDIEAKGNTVLERTFYLIHLTDWVSLFISEYKKVDVTEVKVIDFLKSELAKV